MKVSDFDSFEDFETEALLSGSKQRNWLWFGLIVSLALHIVLCTYFYRTRSQPAEPLLTEPQAAPTFKVKNVDLGSQLEKNSIDQTNAAAKPEPDKTDVQLPDEKNLSTSCCRMFRQAQPCRTICEMSYPISRRWSNRRQHLS